MNVVKATETIEFVPSRVEGIKYVRQVRITNDRLELFSEGRWIKFRFLDLAPGRELRTKLAPIGRLSFSKITYIHSYFEFFTKPTIRIYMPADRPTRYPESDFSQIQQLARSGGFKFLDEYQSGLLGVLRISRLKTALWVLAVLAFCWLYALSTFLPGEAGQFMRGFMFDNPRYPSIALAYMLPMMLIPFLLALFHGRNAVAVFLAMLAGWIIALLSEWCLRLLIDPIVPPDVVTLPHSIWLKQSPVGVFFGFVVPGLIGASLRQNFMEPLSPSSAANSK